MALQMDTRRKRALIVAIMLAVFMASMESTVVATAMPTIAGQLGGIGRYSWVFAAYLLTSTTTVPIFGKLSDLYGRRLVFAAAMIIFLIGSALCGMANSIDQLVWARALQGVGAGGVLPLAFIMIGEMFTLNERARMQGVFSGVWGVSSIVGPLLGGFIVDTLSWSWVFWINLIPGLFALALVWLNWRDLPRPAGAPRPQVDYLGAVLLTVSVFALLIGLQGGGPALRVGLIAGAILLFIALILWERRVAEPILPIPLFHDRLFSTAVGHGILAGWAMFGSLSFVPLFVQVVIGTSATQAGITLTPMLLAWVLASVIGSRLLLRMDYRTLALVGMTLLSLGALLMTRSTVDTTRLAIMVNLALMGTGMGLSVPAFLIAVQSTVARNSLGTATSMLQFSRSIGGTLGVAIMGAVLSMQLAQGLAAMGADADLTAINAMILGGESAGGASAALDDAVRAALAAGIDGVFMLALVAAVLGLIVTALAPRGRIATLAAAAHKRNDESVAEPVAAPVEIL